jgi:hypothetical protein
LDGISTSSVSSGASSLTMPLTASRSPFAIV